MCVYGTAVAMNEKDIVTEVQAVSDKALHLKDGSLALLIFTQRRTDMLRNNYTVLECFSGPMRRPSRV